MSQPSTTPVLLLPGHLCNARLYAPLVDDLLIRHRVDIAELYGYDTVSALAQSVCARIQEPTVVVAHSMGGSVAFEVLRQAPDKVCGLVLIATSARPEYDAQNERRKRAVTLVEAGDWTALTALYEPVFFCPQNLNNRPKLAEEFAAMILELDAVGVGNQQRAFSRRIDSRPSLSSIRCPTLVICGQDDVITPLEHSQEIAAAIAGARLSIIERCGHSPALEQAEQLNDIVARWLQLHQFV